MDFRLTFLGHVAFYSAFPIYFASLRSSMRLIFLYSYIAVVLIVGGFMGALYTMPINGEATVSAGSVSYGALMLSAILLVIVGRNLQIVRNAIKIIVAVNIFKLILFAITAAALDSSSLTNPFNTSSAVFTVSIQVVITGGLLIVVELLLVIELFEWIKSRINQVGLMSALYVAVLIGVLCLDGVLFPLLSGLGTDDLSKAISQGVETKFFLALAYSIPLIGFLVVFRSRIAQYEATPIRLHELFFAPTEALLQEIDRQREALETQELNYRQLTESIGEIFFSMDEQMRITTWNPAAVTRTGLSVADVLGRRPDEVWPETRGTPLIDFYRKTLESGEQDTFTYSDGGPQHEIFEISVFPFDGGASVMVRDITAQRAHERELERRAKGET